MFGSKFIDPGNKRNRDATLRLHPKLQEETWRTQKQRADIHKQWNSR